MGEARPSDKRHGATASSSSSAATMDALSFVLNVSSSVFIVFVNKHLMREQGMGFKYATTLCALHFLTSAAYMWSLVAMGVVKRASMPTKDLVVYCIVANVSIVALNLSLLLNSVGFYQISKLLIIPFVCLVEATCFGRRFPVKVVAAILSVVAGVAVVTVTGDVSIRTLGGMLVAAISVVSSGLQQIGCRQVQQRNGLSSQELLAVTAPVQGVSILVVAPFLDFRLTGAWVGDYALSSSRMGWLALSCGIAVLVNLSQFLVLGRFTAVTFQVLGHSKTILVLLGGWLLFQESISTKQLAGILMAVAGMVWYGYETSNAAGSGAAKQGTPPGGSPRTRHQTLAAKLMEEAAPLLPHAPQKQG